MKDTARDAYVHNRKRAGDQRRRVLLYLHRAGPLTDEQIADRLGIDRARTRRQELGDAIVYDVGRRAVTKSGRNAALWALTDAGHELARRALADDTVDVPNALHRDRSQDPPTPLPTPQDLGWPSPPPDPTPVAQPLEALDAAYADAFGDEARHERIATLLEAMDVVNRTEGLTYTQIADRLGISKQEVSRLRTVYGPALLVRDGVTS